jgi:hypothetical protein
MIGRRQCSIQCWQVPVATWCQEGVKSGRKWSRDKHTIFIFVCSERIMLLQLLAKEKSKMKVKVPSRPLFCSLVQGHEAMMEQPRCGSRSLERRPSLSLKQYSGLKRILCEIPLMFYGCSVLKRNCTRHWSEDADKEKLANANWTGNLPWLRLYCCMTHDPALEALRNKDRVLARDELVCWLVMNSMLVTRTSNLRREVSGGISDTLTL